MQIEEADVPLLKQWLVQKLNPLSDADSEVLADYVLALLQNSMSDDELMAICVEQLADFLQDNTQPFVSDLFNAMNSKAYLGESQAVPAYDPAAAHSSQPQNTEMSDAGAAYNPEEPVTNHSYDNRGFRGGHSHSDRGRGRGRGGFQNSYQGYYNMPMAAPLNMNTNTNMNMNMNMSLEEMQQQYNQMLAMGQDLQNQIAVPTSEGFLPAATSQGVYPAGGFRPMRGARGPGRNKPFSDYSSTKEDPQGTTLVVEKLPADKLNETDVREYFARFGTVTSVSIEADKYLALVEFSSHEEARNAWSCPDPIFDNRFVKLYWKKTSRGGKRSEKSTPEPIDLETIKRIQLEKQKVFEERQEKKRANERALEELKKRKEEILRKHEEQKKALEEKIRQQEGAASGNTSKTEALKAQLEALKKEAELLGIGADPARPAYNPSVRGRGRGRGAYRARGGFSPYGRGGRGGRGGAPPGRFSLDLRPKKVKISLPNDAAQDGENLDEKLRGHLLNFGEYSLETPGDGSTVVAFADRKNAEKFVNDNSAFDGKLVKEWYRDGSENSGADVAME